MMRAEMKSAGVMLREAREDRDMTLEQVSSVINIRVVQLQAIEEGDYDALPGATYAVGFIRSYADHLGLNSAEVVSRFKAEHSVNQAKPDLHFPEPVTQNKLPNPVVIGVAAIAAVLLVVLWAVFTGDDDQVADVTAIEPPVASEQAEGLQVTPETDTAVSMAQGGAVLLPQADNAVTAIPQVATPETVTNTEAVTPVDTVDTVTERPVEATAPVVPEKAEEMTLAQVATQGDVPEGTPPVDAPDMYAIPRKPAPPTEAEIQQLIEQEKERAIKIAQPKSAITLKAVESSWVQIQDRSEEIVFRQVLRAGDEYHVPDQAGLTLITTNAGGLEVYVSGKKVPPLGRSGDVVRGVELDPAQLSADRIRPASRGGR